ncbi:MAG: filamentous hemagglutinin outer membrane protein, partial [Comamonadaceae bacterium]
MIPAGVTVTYDSGVAGITTLSNLSINSANTFNVSGGTLVVSGGSTSISAFNLSGGAVYMYGALTAGTFNQTGGTWHQQGASLPSFSATDFRLTGGTFRRFTSGNGSSAAPYLLTDIYGLQGMGSAGMRSFTYTLTNDIDASGTANWNAGTGFVPVGAAATPFTGSLDGQNHTISNLTINRPTTNHVGLFGYLGIYGASAALRNVGLIGGNVSGSSFVGSLVGYNYGGSISNTYTTGSVTGSNNYVGGLVGYNNSGSISNAYATGSVAGISNVAGLVGSNISGSISNAYATGSVTGSSIVGGLAGSNTGGGSISNSYWDTTTSGQSSSAGGTSLTTAQMQQQSNFTGFDFANTWVSYDGHTAPLLRSFMTPLTVSANNASKTYNGAAYSGGNGVSYSSTPNANLLGTVSYGGTAQGAVNAGNYTLTPGGLYSNQQGYIISYADGSLTVNQLASVSWTGGSTGNWSDSVNWAGGITPNLANVAAVVIP